MDIVYFDYERTYRFLHITQTNSCLKIVEYGRYNKALKRVTVKGSFKSHPKIVKDLLDYMKEKYELVRGKVFITENNEQAILETGNKTLNFRNLHYEIFKCCHKYVYNTADKKLHVLYDPNLNELMVLEYSDATRHLCDIVWKMHTKRSAYIDVKEIERKYKKLTDSENSIASVLQTTEAKPTEIEGNINDLQKKRKEKTKVEEKNADLQTKYEVKPTKMDENISNLQTKPKVKIEVELKSADSLTRVKCNRIKSFQDELQFIGSITVESKDFINWNNPSSGNAGDVQISINYHSKPYLSDDKSCTFDLMKKVYELDNNNLHI